MNWELDASSCCWPTFPSQRTFRWPCWPNSLEADNKSIDREVLVSGLVGACLATGDRIFATGSDSVSKVVLRSCGCFCLISGHSIMVWKSSRSPKHIAIVAVLRSYLSPLFLLLGWDLCGDRILRSCLQKGPATCQLRFQALPKHYAQNSQEMSKDPAIDSSGDEWGSVMDLSATSHGTKTLSNRHFGCRDRFCEGISWTPLISWTSSCGSLLFAQIHAQSCRHSRPSQTFEPKQFFMPIFCLRGETNMKLLGKIPTPVKIKLALPPPLLNKPTTHNPPPKKTEKILWAWGFSCRKNQKILGAHKIGAAISGPRIAGRKITDMRIFLKLLGKWECNSHGAHGNYPVIGIILRISLNQNVIAGFVLATTIQLHGFSKLKSLWRLKSRN